MLTVQQLANAIYQAWHHGELDEFVDRFSKIDGNDHPVLVRASECIFARIDSSDQRPSGSLNDITISGQRG